MVKNYLIMIVGKLLRRMMILRGGGSALPGLFIERADPGFINRALSSLEHGVIVISGTNGKTTTAKMVVKLLESQGLKVFTNRTGSNFVRGVAAALLGEVDNQGRLIADIAVLELDEAHAIHFIKHIKPRYSLLLNVMRDQLDRFGEIDTTAKLLRSIAEATTDTVIINRDDPRLSSKSFVSGLSAEIKTYGVSEKLTANFPSDDQMYFSTKSPSAVFSRDDTRLDDIKDKSTATVSYGDKTIDITLKLSGVYNIQNATGALALCRAIIGDQLNEVTLLEALANVTPAFGRGETIVINDQPVELVLVKNPSGFRLSLSSFLPASYATMIAINDNYADGCDMSWLWDVDFDSLKNTGVAMVSGVRAYDMALRLQYGEVATTKVEPQLKKALASFLKQYSDQPKRIYCTYTAMLAIRQELGKLTKVEVVR